EALRPLQKEIDPIISGRVFRWQGVTSMMINIGAFFGMFGFGALAQRIGRKPTFAIAFLAAFASTAGVFSYLDDVSGIFWMVPIMGFCQLSLFAGYAIYFPELFPTHLRSTGTSFCYNVGRFIAAIGPLIQAQLLAQFRGQPDALRRAGVAMCVVFLIGLFVLPFLPETRGRPLPERSIAHASRSGVVLSHAPNPDCSGSETHANSQRGVRGIALSLALRVSMRGAQPIPPEYE